MADNSFKIVARLDVPASVGAIINDIPKLEKTLRANKEGNVKIVAGLDTTRSTEFIQSQLNAITKQVNAPTIKVGVDVGQNNAVQGIVGGLKEVQTQAQATKKSVHDISTAMKNFEFPVALKHDADKNLITDTVKSIQNARDMFNKLGFDNLEFKWVDDAGGTFDRLKVKVTDAYGAIQEFKFLNNGKSYIYDGSSGSDAGVAKLTNSIQKLQDKTKALRINLTSDLKSIRSAWQDVNGGKSVKSDENIAKLNQQYIKTAQAIRALHNADITTMTSMKANADAQIDKLNQMVAQYHNAEKVATQLRAKGFETVKIDTGNNIDKFVNSINNSKMPIQAMQTEIDKLTKDFAELDSIQDQAGKSAGLTNILNTLDNAQTKFQSLKELFKGFGNANWFTVNSEQINKISDMATKVAIYKQYLTSTRDEWKTQGIYVGEIQSKMASLARSLPNIKKPEKFDQWVSEWNELNQQAINLKANLDEQVVAQNKIYEIQSKIASLNPNKDANKIANLNNDLKKEQEALSNLQGIANVYTKLVSYEEQEKYITEQTVKARQQLNNALAGQTDKATQQRTADMKAYQKQIETAISSLNQLNNSTVFRNNSSNPQVAQTKQEITGLITEYQRLYAQLQANPTSQGLETIRTKLAELDTKLKTTTTSAKAFETQLRGDNSADQLRKKVELLTRQMKAYQATNTKAAKAYKQQFSDMFAILSNPNIDNQAFTTVQKQFQALRQEAIATGKVGKTMFQTIGDAVKKFAGWMSMTYLVSSFARSLRDMVNNVIELDSAMTNLKKVTNETEVTYSKFLKSISKQAKELHSTMTDLIEQTSEWAKLGYDLNQANQLSKASMIYANVGEVDNEQAVTNIVSAMKAFDIAVDDVMSIPDVYNKLGNEFAVSSANLGSSMSQAATTMAMAGNDFNQVAAILTGAGEILGDNKLDEIGNGMKTVTLRIQNQAGALKELGEEYEDLISVSKTQQQVYELTGGAVNIMSESDPNTFRSTYDILKDVANVIDDMNDTEASELVQLLFGKNRANVGTAVLKAFQSGQIEKAYEAAVNSAGSAQKEFDAWSESIEAHINTFKASWESLSQTIVDSKSIKSIVDLGTTILNTLDSIIEKFGTIPTLLGGITAVGAFKNVGGLCLNTPPYAPLQLCA